MDYNYQSLKADDIDIDFNTKIFVNRFKPALERINGKELEADLNENGENEGSLAGLVVDKEDINRKYHKYLEELEDIIATDNPERFSRQLNYYNKETLLKIRRLLNGIKECETEFILSRAMDYAAQIDSDRNKKFLKETQNRIDFINLSQNTVGMMDVISNDEVVEILFTDFLAAVA